MDWRPVQGVSRLSPEDCWDRLQPPPRDPTDGWSGRKWMDGFYTTHSVYSMLRWKVSVKPRWITAYANTSLLSFLFNPSRGLWSSNYNKLYYNYNIIKALWHMEKAACKLLLHFDKEYTWKLIEVIMFKVLFCWFFFDRFFFLNQKNGAFKISSQ